MVYFAALCSAEWAVTGSDHVKLEFMATQSGHWANFSML